ncbi:hypothetical protein, partial [Pararhodobacter sp. SW119]|uniref:hypothetical protein n=1 Tax=Pararhodobacter sp. SW119 TaxID=2780075 RepID=UPI001AE0339A
ENLPRLSFTHKTLRTPATHPEYWQKMSRDARRCWQAWSARSTQIRNVTPLWQADGKPMPYRREIADYMGAMLEALIADCPWQQKRDIFIGLVQLGIDQAAVPQFLNKGTAPTTSGQTSWDAGRSAPTVLAMAALPDNDWLQEAWRLPRATSELYLRMPGSSWEDKRGFNTITEAEQFDPPLQLKAGKASNPGVWNWIDPQPDTPPPGPVPGLVGHATYNGRGTRPESFAALPGS